MRFIGLVFVKVLSGVSSVLEVYRFSVVKVLSGVSSVSRGV